MVDIMLKKHALCMYTYIHTHNSFTRSHLPGIVFPLERYSNILISTTPLMISSSKNIYSNSLLLKACIYPRHKCPLSHHEDSGIFWLTVSHHSHCILLRFCGHHPSCWWWRAISGCSKSHTSSQQQYSLEQ